MTLLAPIAVGTVAIIGTSLAALLVVAYLLRMRRRRFEVPFSTLWQRVLRDHETSSLWKELRRWLSLALLLFILGLLLFAATEPRLGTTDSASTSVVLIIDTSASMQATDAGISKSRPRIDLARERVLEYLSQVSGGSSVMLVKMDSQATPLTRFTDDIASLRKVVNSLKASDTPADLRAALSLARDSLRQRKNPSIVLIGDGVYPREVTEDVVFSPRAQPRLTDIDLSGIDVSFASVGSNGENVGIIAFNVRRYLANKLSYEVFIEIQNFGKETAERRLTLFVDNDPIESKTISLKPGQRVRDLHTDLSGNNGTELLARLEPLPNKPNTDVLAVDDIARALLPERRNQNVLLVTDDNLYLEGAMLVYDKAKTTKLTPAEYALAAKKDDLRAYDAIIFNSVTPDTLPPGNGGLLFFGAEGPKSPFALTGSLTAPHITESNEDHPVSHWLVLKDVNFANSAVFSADLGSEGVVLARSIRSPLIVAKRESGRKFVATGFKLAATDMTLRAAFPLFLVNVLEWFAGDDIDLITTYATGQRIEVPIDSTQNARAANVTTPSGQTFSVPVTQDRAAVYPDRVGKYELSVTGAEDKTAHYELVANLANGFESNIQPASVLTLGGKALKPPLGASAGTRRGFWKLLVVLATLLLCVEWLTYQRRITV